MILKRAFDFVIVPVAPYDFGLTVRKPAGWSLLNAEEIYRNNTFWTVTRIMGRIFGIRLRSTGSIDRPRIESVIFSDKGVTRSEMDVMADHLRLMLGADQDLSEFYAFAKKDDILRHTVRDLYGMHDTQTSYLLNSVILSICLQMAKLERSQRMMESINRNYGDPVEFDGKKLIVEPSVERIASLKPEVFAKKCNLGYRAKYIISSAKAIESGFPDTEEILSMSPEDARNKLKELPGVGDYSADIINPHGGFPIDAWSVDVFGALFFGREPDNARDAIESVKKEGLRRWGKWAWMGFFYVAQDLDNLSRKMRIKLRMI